MEPRLFDAHCHLDLMAHPDAVADEATRWAWVYLIAASIHATFRPQTSALVATRASSPALGFTPGGSPMATAVLPKSICFAKLLPKNATSAKSDSTFPRALLEVSRYKYRHLTGSAMRSCSILLPGA